MEHLKFKDASDAKDLSIEQFGIELEELWPDFKNIPILFIWQSVIGHTSRLCEEVRRSRWDRITFEIAEVFLWWLIFIQRLKFEHEKNENLKKSYKIKDLDIEGYALKNSASRILWNKYPGVCPQCFHRYLVNFFKVKINDIKAGTLILDSDQKLTKFNNHILKKSGKNNYPVCSCLAFKKEVEDRDNKNFLRVNISVYAKKFYSERPRDLLAYNRMFDTIFENNTILSSISDITFHLLEEVGEVGEALNNIYILRKTNRFIEEKKINAIYQLEEELADVFSWLTALLMKIDIYLNCGYEFSKSQIDHSNDKEHLRIALSQVKEFQEPTSNLPELIWTTHKRGDQLSWDVQQL